MTVTTAVTTAVPLPPLPTVALGLAFAVLPVGLVAVAGHRRLRGRSRRRLRRMFAGHRVAAGPHRRCADRLRWAALAAGVATAVVLGGWYGVAAGAVVAVVLDRGLRRLEPGTARRARLAAAAELPFAVDLLAASGSAGWRTALAWVPLPSTPGRTCGPSPARTG